MQNPMFNIMKRYPVLIGIAIGVALFIIFLLNRPLPERDVESNKSILARYVVAEKSHLLIEARGYGIAKPAETWKAVSSVSGRVIERHQNLENGIIIKQGELLVALDPSRYEIIVADSKAEIKSLHAELSHLAVEEESARKILRFEQERLSLAETELNRMEDLQRTGSIAQSRLDEQSRITITQRQAVSSLENSLALIPTQKDLINARLERSKLRLMQAKRDSADTRFIAPYDLRLGAINVELHQFVGVGALLFEADNLNAMEVEARIPLEMMRRVITHLPRAENVNMSTLEALNLSELNASLELIGSPEVFWQGEVVRISSGLDPRTRTVRVVIRVNQPYERQQLPQQPILQREMYTHARISTASSQPLIIIPAHAVHRGQVYLIDEDDRLHRRSVIVDFEQQDIAVIRSGISKGERIITDDIAYALDGVLVDAQEDSYWQEKLASITKGDMQ